MSAASFFRLLFVSILLVEIIELAAVCGPGMYFSTFVGGCTPCKVNCGDQGNDAEACGAACVSTSTTKAVTRSTSDSTTQQQKEDVSTTSDSTTEQPKEDVSTTSDSTTKQPKEDVSTTSDSTTEQQKEDVSTTDVNKITATKTKPYNNSTKGPEESDTSGLSDGELAAIIAGIFVFIVFVIIAVVYFRRLAAPSGANTKPVDVGERVEMCDEPPTSSGDASPNTIRLLNGEDKGETVAVQESNKSPDFHAEDPYESRLHMQETELI